MSPTPKYQGTRSSKKKKERKLNRVMGTVKKATRKGQESHSESFAALHLLHDPQVCVREYVGSAQMGSTLPPPGPRVAVERGAIVMLLVSL